MFARQMLQVSDKLVTFDLMLGARIHPLWRLIPQQAIEYRFREFRPSQERIAAYGLGYARRVS
jgi:hypothetical protein